MASPRLGASLAASLSPLMAVLGLVWSSVSELSKSCGYMFPGLGGDTLTRFREFTPG